MQQNFSKTLAHEADPGRCVYDQGVCGVKKEIPD
jgi:hypothetical protein